MDMGFGALLEKIEEHFGRGVTRFLLVLIGLTIVALCGSVIWGTLIKPLVQLIAGFIPGRETPEAYQLTTFVLMAMLVMLALNYSLDFANNVLKTRLNRQLALRVRQAKDMVAETEQTQAMAKATMAEAKDILTTTELALDEVYEYCLANGLMTEEQKATLQGLRQAAKNAREASE